MTAWRPLTADQRTRIEYLLGQGLTHVVIAQRVGVSDATVSAIARQQRQRENLAQHGGGAE